MEQAELRRVATDSRKIGGCAVPYNTRSQLMGGWFYEVITPEAVIESINSQDVVFIYEHNIEMIQGRVSSGTLKLEQRANGLYYECDLPTSPNGENLLVSVTRKDINQMSFGFNAIEESWDFSNNEYAVRTLTKINLFEISATAFPVYTGTEANRRSSNFNNDHLSHKREEFIKSRVDNSDILRRKLALLSMDERH